jgi:hypothetical protein
LPSIQSAISFSPSPPAIVVIKEIESWYLAGLTEDSADELEVPYFSDTSDIDKQLFIKVFN